MGKQGQRQFSYEDMGKRDGEARIKSRVSMVPKRYKKLYFNAYYRTRYGTYSRRPDPTYKPFSMAGLEKLLAR